MNYLVWCTVVLVGLAVWFFPYRLRAIDRTPPPRPAITTTIERVDAPRTPLVPTDIGESTEPLAASDDEPERRTIYIHVQQQSLAQGTSTATAAFGQSAREFVLGKQYQVTIGGRDVIISFEVPVTPIRS